MPTPGHDHFAYLIGYVQEEDTKFWNERVADWISALADKTPGWTSKDMLQLRSSNEAQQTATLDSSHTRNDGLPDIELCHLWVKMN